MERSTRTLRSAPHRGEPTETRSRGPVLGAWRGLLRIAIGCFETSILRAFGCDRGHARGKRPEPVRDGRCDGRRPDGAVPLPCLTTLLSRPSCNYTVVLLRHALLTAFLLPARNRRGYRTSRSVACGCARSPRCHPRSPRSHSKSLGRRATPRDHTTNRPYHARRMAPCASGHGHVHIYAHAHANIRMPHATLCPIMPRVSHVPLPWSHTPSGEWTLG
jgi:hypothetical protein